MTDKEFLKIVGFVGKELEFQNLDGEEPDNCDIGVCFEGWVAATRLVYFKTGAREAGNVWERDLRVENTRVFEDATHSHMTMCMESNAQVSPHKPFHSHSIMSSIRRRIWSATTALHVKEPSLMLGPFSIFMGIIIIYDVLQPCLMPTC